MAMGVILRAFGLVISGVSFDAESPADQGPIVEAFHAAGDTFEQEAATAQVLLETWYEVWEQIDEPGDKHIAR
jgi:hypothetical protein